MQAITEIVAIDGPAGAGKSSVSRAVAERLGFAFLDSGAMYRAATWWAMHRGVDLEDAEALAASTRAMSLKFSDEEGSLRIRVDDQDITEAIRLPEVTERIRKLDAIPAVREPLMQLQRELASRRPTVAEGRDMGTVVFPDAKCKIFLDASLEIRTQRRARELSENAQNPDLDQLREAIHRRDEGDRTRATAPLRKAEDAHVLDSTAMSIEQVVDTIVSLARKAFSGP